MLQSLTTIYCSATLQRSTREVHAGALASYPGAAECDVCAICHSLAVCIISALQVKFRGFRIELTEIDHHLSTFAGVKQALSIVHKDTMQQQHLVGYVSPASISIDDLRRHAAQFLPKHMVPETFVMLDEFPRLPNGKSDRNSLPEPQYSTLAEAEYEAPRNETDAAVSSTSSLPWQWQITREYARWVSKLIIECNNTGVAHC